ncbi:MAG: hypothetical protein R3Y11_06545, partial [Pseudomonadota bacterium]
GSRIASKPQKNKIKVAHFFVSVSGSKIHERVAHFFVDNQKRDIHAPFFVSNYTQPPTSSNR